ncbi:hypothetical protein [Actinokineospora iranica]|uniref:Uncharacterized protein n=1 Tax=Actinokineospora iranica TaxID=1271860 RepID=A0A1G6JP57_9PSEU|nr:hypothetical protein [Actinokineospora iranica]SDC20483.1 hypothetical protein SAMN05216174_101497 [Actinokineospora iranica]
MSNYAGSDVRRDAAMPRGFAPEDGMPDEIRRTERLRGREVGYRLAESLIIHGAPAEVAALLIAVPHDEPDAERKWAVRVEDAELCGDRRRCSMPVRGCRHHGDTVAWRYGEWVCRVPKCRGRVARRLQRRHCDLLTVAVIDYPSGHQRRVCAGHLASEQAVWAEAPAETPTIRVTPVPTGPAAEADTASTAGAAEVPGPSRLTVVDGGR